MLHHMGAFSDAVKNKMLDAVTGRATYTAEAAVFVQLHVGSPGAAGTANVAGHTTRVAATFGSAPSAGSISNTVAVSFTSLTTAETQTHVSLWSASSGGTFLGADDLPVSKTVAVGDTHTIAIGALTLSVTGALP
jgi:hypothetical protein